VLTPLTIADLTSCSNVSAYRLIPNRGHGNDLRAIRGFPNGAENFRSWPTLLHSFRVLAGGDGR
jgi:hypothetical protein